MTEYELHLPQPCYTEGDADALLRLYEREEDAGAEPDPFQD